MELKETIEKAGPHGEGKTSNGSWRFKVTLGEVAFYFQTALVDSVPMGLFDDDTWEVIIEQVGIEKGDWIKREDVYCEPSARGCKVVGVTDARIALATDRLLCTCHFPKWHKYTLISKGPSKSNEIHMGQAEVSGNGRYWKGPLPKNGTPDGRYDVYLKPMNESA